MAKVRTLVFTTERNHEWIKQHEDEILGALRMAKGVEVDSFEYRFADVRPMVVQRSDGRMGIDWAWFENTFTAQARMLGFNAVAFHFTRDKRTEWKLDKGINGTYNRDADDIWEFWLCADQGQKSDRIQKYPISQYARVFIHELGGHGFIHWFQPERIKDDVVHDYDYNKKDIKALLATIDATKWTMLKTLKDLLEKLVALLLLKNQQPKPSRLDDWAAAIKDFEGYFPPGGQYPEGSVSFRNNNPGNLRWSPFEDGNRNNFSYFNTYEKGWEALLHQLRIAANGQSKVYSPEDTLLRFFEKYAPSSDNNYPEVYANFVAKRMGVPVTTKIKTLL